MAGGQIVATLLRLLFSHIDQFSMFMNHQGVLIHIFKCQLDNLAQIGRTTTVDFHEAIRTVFGLESPFSPHRHDPWNISADNPVSLVGIDLVFGVKVSDSNFVDGFVGVQRHVDGSTVYRAYAVPASIIVRNNHP